MAEIAVRVSIEVLKNASRIIADLIANEGCRLSQLQEEVAWVEREMRHIHSYLKDVEHKQGESERLANLMTDIRDLAFDVEDTMEKYFPFPRRREGFRGFLRRTSRILLHSFNARKFLVRIEAIKARVGDINRVRQTYGISEPSDRADIIEQWGWDERRSFPHVDEQNITGFGDHARSLVARVHDGDSRLRVISIIGMAGLGKTTLAKKVYNSVRNSIYLTAWVYVSERPIVKNILQDIARQVGLKIEKWEDDGEAILFDRLSQHRYLIVVDDIWHIKTWEALKNAIPTNSEKCSRIILTSRNRDVGVHVGGWSSLFALQPLDERFSKQLFETSMGPPHTEMDTPELERIGKKILHRCGGVPLAIVVVAGSLKLKERSTSAWNGLLEQMDQAGGEYSKIFALSYMDLPTNLKPCFLYLGIFPEDHEIDAFDLINLWAAEGFIQGSRVREVEDVGDDYLNHLVSRNLVQVVRRRSNRKVKSCRIHDILRSLCIQKAKEINFFHSAADLTCYNDQRVRRVTTHGIGLRDHISSNRQTPKLRSFLCFNDDVNQELLRGFPRDLNFLRAAYFHVTADLSPLSKKLWSFRNLTYLKVQNDGGPVRFPTTIVILESLVTLDLQGFGWGHHFPMVILNMKRLRHLLLPSKRKLNGSQRYGKCMYKGFDGNAISFQNFQTLAVHGQILQVGWLPKFSNLRTLKITTVSAQMADLLLTSPIKLNKLESLRLEWGTPFKDCYRQISGSKTVRTLNLTNFENLTKLSLNFFNVDQWPQPDCLPPSLTKLVLIEVRFKGDPLEIMKKIPKLSVLKLVRCLYDTKVMVCTREPGNFVKLEELVVISDSTIQILIEDGGMPSLKKLYARVILKPKVPVNSDGCLVVCQGECFLVLNDNSFPIPHR